MSNKHQGVQPGFEVPNPPDTLIEQLEIVRLFVIAYAHDKQAANVLGALSDIKVALTERPSEIFGKWDKSLAENLKDDGFRKHYIETHTWLSLAVQIKNLRGGMSQEDFAKKLGKPQSVISRLENPDSPKSLQSLFDVAYACNLTLLVKFMPFDGHHAERESGELERARLALTPSSVTKAALMGEFYVPWVERDEKGEEFMRKINVPWTTIKEIMKAIHKMAFAEIEDGGSDGSK